MSKRFGDGTMAVKDLTLELPDGEFMILVGPSGCGKTTVLRMVAGLEDATDGVIRLGDRVVNDVDPAHRDIAMVFQSYALFPHMTVRQNMAFPLKMRGTPKADVATSVMEAAKLLQLEQLLDRKPNELSGGQRQRVAMGRAIVRRPQVFLLDEPLSNLDAKLRTQLRAELGRLHRRLGVTTLYVTHDQTEAMTLGTRVAVLRDGVMQQVGTPRELYHRPANAFVGRFLGSPPMNLLRAEIADGKLSVPGAAGPPADFSRWATGESRNVLIGVRAEAWREGPPERPEEAVTLSAEIDVVEELGSEAIAYFNADAAVVGVDLGEEGDNLDAFVTRLHATHALAPGDRVQFHVDVADLHVFDGETGEALELSPAAQGGVL